MGSTSDWNVMSGATAILDSFGIEYEKRVLSAHRTPAQLEEWASGARERGLCAIIAGAGGAAHLAGVVAALTGTEVPATGGMVETFYAPLQRNIHIWRMPSSSRAYPLAVEKKAMMYEAMFKAENIL